MFEFIEHSGDVIKKVWGTETWIFSAHPENPSVVEVGDKEYNFLDLLKKHKEYIFGNIECSDFPILVKIIDPNETLSVQVHPSEEDAKKLGENDHGKEEAWVVLSDRGFVYLGFEGDFSEVEEDVIKKMHRVDVKRLDAINIPSGTLHALGAGTKVLEVSTNSNITYRVYDFGRGRELHLDKAKKVVKKRSLDELLLGSIRDKPLNTEFFRIEYLHLKGSKEFLVDSFVIIVCTAGKANITGKQEKTYIDSTKHVLVPGSIGRFVVEGNAELFIISPGKQCAK
ncbi:type I phosphomannose isomerase catalytic subunit [Thermococcus sp. SY098]|uniref:type I phosphomannose isomerase catalytic subunit n=1 Tax=Thermococcus sp. SY098 TaxID=3111325 RepID=UPI002D779DFE|nr:type I phosphomannose isomerase catalytic subunit [Thermococcus sp. SY098]WRS52293.1 type I phosphomannose isomerase catalytic subunit [Thermococcus sp. SY098]